jgi:hypothetical protein
MDPIVRAPYIIGLAINGGVDLQFSFRGRNKILAKDKGTAIAEAHNRIGTFQGRLFPIVNPQLVFPVHSDRFEEFLETPMLPYLAMVQEFQVSAYEQGDQLGFLPRRAVDTFSMFIRIVIGAFVKGKVQWRPGPGKVVLLPEIQHVVVMFDDGRQYVLPKIRPKTVL